LFNFLGRFNFSHFFPSPFTAFTGFNGRARLPLRVEMFFDDKPVASPFACGHNRASPLGGHELESPFPRVIHHPALLLTVVFSSLDSRVAFFFPCRFPPPNWFVSFSVTRRRRCWFSDRKNLRAPFSYDEPCYWVFLLVSDYPTPGIYRYPIFGPKPSTKALPRSQSQVLPRSHYLYSGRVLGLVPPFCCRFSSFSGCFESNPCRVPLFTSFPLPVSVL